MAAPVCVARIGAAHGVRGAVKLWTFTEDPLAVQSYGPLMTKDGARRFEIEHVRAAKDHLVTTFKGIATRNDAEKLNGIELYVPREKLPDTADGEYYHADLIGLAPYWQQALPDAPDHNWRIVPAAAETALALDSGMRRMRETASLNSAPLRRSMAVVKRCYARRMVDVFWDTAMSLCAEATEARDWWIDRLHDRMWVRRSPEEAEDQHRLRGVLAERRTDSQAYFGRIAGEWDHVRQELFGDRFTPLSLMALLRRDWVAADLGCGTGNAAELLAPFVARVIALDRSGPMLEAARRRLAGVRGVEFREAGVEATGLPDRSVQLELWAWRSVP